MRSLATPVPISMTRSRSESPDMNTAIKAIQTRYKGHHFRSRVEARWAVFFDHQEIEWVYEKEGFGLPSGGFLPDFWLPQVNMWAECKGGDFSDDEIRKCYELSQMTNHACLLLEGPPRNRVYWATHRRKRSVKTDRSDGYPCLLDYYMLGRPIWKTDGKFYRSCGFVGIEGWNGHNNNQALVAANSARFEFGGK